MFGAAARTRAEPDSKSARDEMLFWLALTSVARLIVTARAKRTFQRHICNLYREDWGGNWAGSVPSEHFTALDDYHRTLKDFIVYCNITVAPKFQWELL